MGTIANLVTAEQLFEMGSDAHFELVKGVLREMSPTRIPHGVVVGKISYLLGSVVYPRALGVVCGAETGFILELDPDTVLAPDVSFIQKDKLTRQRLPRTLDNPPDLAVEVMSPSDSWRKMERKAQEWLDFGCPLVWVADPQKEKIGVYRRGVEPRFLQGEDPLAGEDIVPGFSVRTAEVFQ